MIGAVRDGRIHIALSQPITQQTFNCLNPWHPDGADTVRIDVWSSRAQTWHPVAYNSLSLRLEHSELPVLCLPSGHRVGPPPPRVIERFPRAADMISCGSGPTSPMCSMKAQMYDLPYIWPDHFRYPRAHYHAVWAIDRDQPYAIRPYKVWAEDVITKYGHGNKGALGIKDAVEVDSDSEY